MIAALLLAAGASRRFGSPKLVQELGGKALIRRSAEFLRRPEIGATYAVVPTGSPELAERLEGLDVRLVTNDHPERGSGFSIALGVRELSADVEAILIFLADEPAPSVTALTRVLERYWTGSPIIVAPRFRGVRGHPVLFDRSVFGELAALDGDRGARDVVDRRPDRVAFVEVDEDAPADIDTPEDLAHLMFSPTYSNPRSQ